MQQTGRFSLVYIYNSLSKSQHNETCKVNSIQLNSVLIKDVHILLICVTFLHLVYTNSLCMWGARGEMVPRGKM